MKASAYSPEVHEKIVEAYSLGLAQRGVAGYAGIHEQTLMNWLRLGREGHEVFAKLVADMESGRSVRVSKVMTQLPVMEQMKYLRRGGFAKLEEEERNELSKGLMELLDRLNVPTLQDSASKSEALRDEHRSE